MPRVTTAKELDQLISKLQAQRAGYVEEIEKIDAIFARYGIGGGVVRRGRGRPAKAAGAVVGRRGRRRKRGSFAKTGEQSILDFIKSHGKPSTADVNVHWKKEGRGGKADNTLTRLVKEGRLKRVASKDVRGSRYAVA
ncbi:MAG: hypothetical protein IT442_15220 [Phycisphaeraceae bacterium]|nr:hypothetical protein [Phycisphaeraceae bacterium]